MKEETKIIYEVHYYQDGRNEELRRFSRKKEAIAFAQTLINDYCGVEIIKQEVLCYDGNIEDYGDFSLVVEWIKGKKNDLRRKKRIATEM